MQIKCLKSVINIDFIYEETIQLFSDSEPLRIFFSSAMLRMKTSLCATPLC